MFFLSSKSEFRNPKQTRMFEFQISFWFHFQRQSLHAGDLNRLTFLHRSVADRVPIFAFYENAAGMRINGCQCGHGFPEQGFRSDFHRQALRAQVPRHQTPRLRSCRSIPFLLLESQFPRTEPSPPVHHR